MYVVEVKYQNQIDDRTWTYFVDDTIILNVNDYVVVPVLDDCALNVAIVQNILFDPVLEVHIDYKWVVQKVDFAVWDWCVQHAPITVRFSAF